jgi:hypothetical protein
LEVTLQEIRVILSRRSRAATLRSQLKGIAAEDDRRISNFTDRVFPSASERDQATLFVI